MQRFGAGAKQTSKDKQGFGAWYCAGAVLSAKVWCCVRFCAVWVLSKQAKVWCKGLV
jgi:hypothetical protein